MNDFVPYHPVKLRRFLALGAVLALVLTGWAAWAFVESRAPKDILRAGLSGGLAAAMVFSWLRFRPRDGWGVRLTPLSVLISRPRGVGTIEVPWASVREVRRFGDDRDTLGLFLDEQQRVLVPAHLFATRATFEALCAQVDERFHPRKGNDAVN